MQAKQTLYDYVYQNLHEQIISGRLHHGDRLPSMSSLCEFYHVGIRTVKDVLSALRAQGYIRTEERRPAVVIYRRPGEDQEDPAFLSVLGRRTSMREVHRTVEIVMPPLLAFCAQFFSEQDVKNLSRQLARLRGRAPELRGQACTELFYTLLERSKNLLLRNLFASFELYIGMPFFRSRERYLQLVAEHNRFGSTEWVLQALADRDEEEIISRFGLLFGSVTDAVDQYLDELCSQFGEVPEEPQAAFDWRADRGRGHYYTQIAHDLINKIALGIYPEGSFLPSEAQLARQYGVCVSTVRSALSMLNALGFGQTLNAKGTRVVLQTDSSVAGCMKNKIYRHDALVYLSGLQLMAILIRPAALLAFEQIDAVQRRLLQEQMSHTDIPLDYLVQCISDRQTLPPMRTILQQLRNLLYWGYYFVSFHREHIGLDLLREKSLRAFDLLQEEDPCGFADALSDCYCQILDLVRDFLERRGLSAAGTIITPHRRA